MGRSRRDGSPTADPADLRRGPGPRGGLRAGRGGKTDVVGEHLGDVRRGPTPSSRSSAAWSHHLADSLEPVEPPAALGSRILAAISGRGCPAGRSSNRRRPSRPPGRCPRLRSSEPARPRRRHRPWSTCSAQTRPTAVPCWPGSPVSRPSCSSWGSAAGTWQFVRTSGPPRRMPQPSTRSSPWPGRPAARRRSSPPMSPAARAASRRSGADGQVKLAMRGLAATSGSQVYEAWVIGAGPATPVAIGSFTPDAHGFGTLATTTSRCSGVTIALTLEPTAVLDVM